MVLCGTAQNADTARCAGLELGLMRVFGSYKVWQGLDSPADPLVASNASYPMIKGQTELSPLTDKHINHEAISRPL